VTDGTGGLCGTTLPAGQRRAQHGGDTSNREKVVTMRPVRILLVAIALVAAGIAGWALARGDGYRSGADPAATEAPAPADPAPTPQAPMVRDDAPGTTQPAPRPRIFGFGSEPVYPEEGGFWQLPPGPGLAILVTNARYATRVEFLLTPTGTGTAAHAVSLGVDTDGRDGYTARWHFKDQPLLAHLTVRATGPGGVAEHTVGVYHPDPAEQS
jgi:hypothetical protein